MASCVVVTAVFSVLITAVAIIVAFATPNWLKFRGSNPTSLCTSGSIFDYCKTCDCGLWLRCHGDITEAGNLDNCRWFFADDFYIEQNLPNWFKAVQGMMGVAVASSLLALLIALFSLCCYCKNCNPHQAACAFIGLTFLLVASSVCVFGAKSHLESDAQVKAETLSFHPLFGWSFWVAVGAGGMAFISTILYCALCTSRRNELV
ncbi:uncharacterized protein LOC143291619 [Babylonia areolata]|uniref:uncharacterized protein LOC143291619 n=1 Tax=Babylonia areolata TaxID=304850 RepID=UPI003FD4DD9C